jgi:RHS repeat-associated protein
VRRKVYGVETWSIYGMDGELLAEYPQQVSASSPQKEYGYRNGQMLVTTQPNGGNLNVLWLVTDQLGTPRMVVDKTGSLAGVSRHDYLPFGEEIFAGTGGRTTAQGYTAADGVRQKFTRKERDIETGLDYFLARYYSSTQGRFTSPDEFTGGPDELYYFAEDASENPTFYADLTNPQSLNKYQYTYNNPINLTDDDGHCPICKIIIDHYSGRVERAAQRNPEVALDVTQAVVSVVGIVPGAGEVADVANAGISLARGNKADAALDLAGALGPVGSIAAAGNRIRKIAKAASKADDLVDATKVVKKADNAADAAKATPSGPPKKDMSVEGTQVQHKNIQQAQKVHRKAGRPDRIRSIKKSDQNVDNALKKIKTLKDAENQ